MNDDVAPHPSSIPADQLPRHVAIIMDGNGRWATRRGLARMEGHEAGTENIRRILRHAAELGIRYLTLWAFSTENWRRPTEEVTGLMNLLGHVIEEETAELNRQGARLIHIGDLSALDPDLAERIRKALAVTQGNDRIILTLAFNYGGQQEMVHAMRSIIEAGIPADQVTEQTIREHLYAPELPDADLIIRTSGEYRMSNFLLWQGAFAEFYFSDKLWPDFDTDDLDAAVRDYASRERRFGATSAQLSASS